MSPPTRRTDTDSPRDRAGGGPPPGPAGPSPSPGSPARGSGSGRPIMALLNQRLQELRAAGVVEKGPGGYGLTHEGRRLLEAFPPLGAWAERWAERVARG